MYVRVEPVKCRCRYTRVTVFATNHNVCRQMSSRPQLAKQQLPRRPHHPFHLGQDLTAFLRQLVVGGARVPTFRHHHRPRSGITLHLPRALLHPPQRQRKLDLPLRGTVLRRDGAQEARSPRAGHEGRRAHPQRRERARVVAHPGLGGWAWWGALWGHPSGQF